MDGFKSLVGKKVLKIFVDSDYLIFQTDQGQVAYMVEGDCCSTSYFYDFVGVEKLLKNGPVLSWKSIPLELPANEKPKEDEYIQCYGFELVTEDPAYGEVTSVVSFRNSSNGYYGGWMEEIGECGLGNKKEILTDWSND